MNPNLGIQHVYHTLLVIATNLVALLCVVFADGVDVAGGGRGAADDQFLLGWLKAQQLLLLHLAPEGVGITTGGSDPVNLWN